MPANKTIAYRVTIAAIFVAIGSYYLWQLRAAGERLQWAHGGVGYYNYLGRAFAHGQLALPLQPSPRLLAASNPWDPSLQESDKIHDMVYFHRRYYLYHGAAPAVLLFTPWLLITGHDLPERFAVFLFSFGGFLFSCAVLMRWLNLLGATPRLPLLAAMLLALGLCSGVPYLLNRVAIYEIAITSGYFFISAALYFLTRGVESNRPAHSTAWLTASGLCFGGAIASRPHLGIAGFLALAALVFLLPETRRLAGFLCAFGLVGGLVALYNYQRFGNPFEFGVRYLLTGPEPIGIKLSVANLWPGLYYWIICPPAFSRVFPFVRLVFRYPFDSLTYHLPHDYFLESLTGVLFVAPFVVAAFFLPFTRRAVLLWLTLASSLAAMLFVMATGFTTQRYEVDFLPMAILVALAACAIWVQRTRGWARVALVAALALSIFFGAVVNLALGIIGPYGHMLESRPANYVRLARWFSPAEKFRPILNPVVDVRFTAEFESLVNGSREPLLVLGDQPYRYILYVEHVPGGLRFTSLRDQSEITADLPGRDDIRAHIRVTYNPQAGELAACVNGQQIALHPLPNLVLAPAEVAFGVNRVQPGLTNQHFYGRIKDESVSVQPSGVAARPHRPQNR